ncbi:MAG: hypothetical protein ACM3PE_07580 [Deltaproteobacteria bacterium]
MSTLAQLVVKVGADVSGVTKGLSTVETKMQGFQQKMQTIGTKLEGMGRTMTAAVTLPIVGAAAASFKLASDMTESINKVDVAFKGNAKEVKAWSQTTLKSFGIAKGTALDMAAKYGDMATSLGLNTKQAADMSTSLVGLAGDLASFKNIGIDIADTALTSIFTGETESLKQLGIVMTQANLDEYALSQGIKKKTKDMTQAEQVQLRYNYVMAMTKNAHGDFVRTGAGAANQMRIFSESLKELGATMGENLLPLITPIITKINQWVQKFGELSPATQKTIMIIAGVIAAIGPLLIAFGMAANAITAISAALPVLGTAFAALTGPVGLAIAIIGGLIAAGVLLYKNWDTVKIKAIQIWTQISDFLKKQINKIIGFTNGLIAGLNKLPSVNIKPIKLMVESSGTNGVADFRRLEQKSIRGNAFGTNFWPGGLSWVGERGPELVDLPRGSRVLSNNKSMALLQSGTITHTGTVIHRFETNDRQVVARIAEQYKRDNLRLPTRVSTIPIQA